MDEFPFKIQHTDGDGGREVFEGSLHRIKNTEASDTSPKHTKAPFGHLGWTLWLILLNVAPNDTVNWVMDTETFDYGSFWLMVKRSSTLVGVSTFGLSIVAMGYLSILVKMIAYLWCPKQTYLVHQITNKALMDKVEKALNDAADQRTASRVTSATIKFAVSLTHEDSSTRKRIFVDLALETLLLYQMLEAGSPTPLVGILTVVVISNTLSCASMMFVPFERAPLAETFVDIMSDSQTSFFLRP
ncbi:unnamed protein product [Phytophthora lilii]|uniref:Unnamed protein product n=1 Tax=Phytophthora lilii TaxID=2077276 RepID=A0A9W6XK38_9STRA|nr:unnamed protein product [Phytophthora lilii]